MCQRGMLFIVVLGLSLAGLGCGGKSKRPAVQYIEEANENFRSGSLAVAIEQYKELLDEHPFSEFSETAELGIAHAHYLDESYPEAVVALSDFQRRHPTSPHLAFVSYLLGMCYVQQIDTIDRDYSSAQNAQSYFLTASQQFPSSPFAELARQELARCRAHLAAHEMYVANYYQGQGNDRAAEIRWLELIARYEETDESAAALLKLGQNYQARGQEKEAALAFQALMQLHPRSDAALAGKEALGKLGADGAAAGDPIDTLLALNGRDRNATSDAAPIPVPGLEPSRGPRGGAVPALPGIGGGFDPFSRGRSGRAF